jgi:hypothetical protein
MKKHFLTKKCFSSKIGPKLQITFFEEKLLPHSRAAPDGYET